MSQKRMSSSSQHPLFNQYDSSQPYYPTDPHQPPNPTSSFTPLPPSHAQHASPPSASSYPSYPNPPMQQYGHSNFSNVLSSDEDEAPRARPEFGRGASTASRGGGGTQGAGPVTGQARTRSGCSAFMNEFNTSNQIIFLSLILFQAVAVLVMIALVYGSINMAIGDIPLSTTFDSDPRLESVATYLSLFILAEIFEMFVTLDALHQKNTMQLLLLLAFQIAMITYSAFLPSQLHKAIIDTTADTASVWHHVKGYSITIPCILALVTSVMAGMVWKLYGEFGWDVFKRIGADLQLKRMYAMYQFFVCLLKFDAFFFIGFSIQFLVLVSGTPTAEFVITIAALPIILACLLLAAIVVRREIRSGVYCFFFLDVCGMAYFLYKLVRIFDPDSGDRYSTAKKTLTIFSVISFLMLLITFIITGLCLNNFDRGLKDNIPPYAKWGRSNTRRRPPGEKVGAGSGFGTGGYGVGKGEHGDEMEMGGGPGRLGTRMSLD